MEGITQEQLASIQQQCIFCQIAAGKVSSKKIYEDEHVVAVLDINPANPGHILVITKKHYFVMPQIPDDETEYIGKISKQLSQALLKALKTEGTTVFIANGVAAGQRAQHFMMHIIPRKEGDGVGINIQPRQISDEDYKKIHKALLQGVEKSLGKIEGLEKETEEIEDMEERAEEKAEEKEIEDAEILEEEAQEKQSVSGLQNQEDSGETKPKIIVDQKKRSGKKKTKTKEGASLDDIAKVLGV